MARLDAIEAEISAARLPKWFGEQAYLLRAAVELVRERLRAGAGHAPPGQRVQEPGRGDMAPPGDSVGGDLKA
jgi:hypothetical protein